MILASTAALFSTAFAAPRYATRQASPVLFNVALTNDLSGASQTAAIEVNGGAFLFSSLFDADANGRVVATSIQAVNPGAGLGNVACAIIDPVNPDEAFRLNFQTTFVDFDGNNEAAIPVDVTDFTIACEA